MSCKRAPRTRVPCPLSWPPFDFYVRRGPKPLQRTVYKFRSLLSGKEATVLPCSMDCPLPTRGTRAVYNELPHKPSPRELEPPTTDNALPQKPPPRQLEPTRPSVITLRGHEDLAPVGFLLCITVSSEDNYLHSPKAPNTAP